MRRLILDGPGALHREHAPEPVAVGQGASTRRS